MYSDVRFKRCKVHAFVVIPNHVHLLATQFVPLAKWLGPLKGAKKDLGLRDRVFWQNESYDHLVGSDEEFRRIQRYIELNPVKAAASSDPSGFVGRAQAPPGKAASRQECPPYADLRRLSVR